MEKFHWKNSFSSLPLSLPPFLSLPHPYPFFLSSSPHFSSFFLSSSSSLFPSVFFNTSRPYFILFCFIQYTIFAGTVVFYKLKICGGSAEQVYYCYFPTAFAHFVHPYHILFILTTCKFFVINTIFIINSILWWSVLFNHIILFWCATNHVHIR